MKKEMKVWYAVSKTGQGRVFTSRPERNEHWGIWEGESMGFVTFLFMHMEAEGLEIPSLKWSDDPVQLMISLEY